MRTNIVKIVVVVEVPVTTTAVSVEQDIRALLEEHPDVLNLVGIRSAYERWHYAKEEHKSQYGE